MKMAPDDRFIDAEQVIAGSPEVDAMETETVARLAAMPPMDYDRVREVEAERLKVRVTTLDREVELSRRRGHRTQSGDASADFLIDPEPWPEPVSVDHLLDRLTEVARTHLVLPAGAAEAIAPWVLTPMPMTVLLSAQCSG